MSRLKRPRPTPIVERVADLPQPSSIDRAPKGAPPISFFRRQEQVDRQAADPFQALQKPVARAPPPEPPPEATTPAPPSSKPTQPLNPIEKEHRHG